MGRILDEDLLARDGENSIIAGSNIQHIINGTPDYTDPKGLYNTEYEPEVRNSREVNVASKATIPFAEGDIIDRNDIISTLEGNFDEYKTDGRNLEIAAGAVYDIQSGRGGSAVSGSGRNMDGSSSISGRNASGAIRSLSSTQYRTIAKGITSSLVREGYIDFRGKKISGPEDLAVLGQVLRDPRFELNDRAKMEGSITK